MGHRTAIFNGIRAASGAYLSPESRPSSRQIKQSLELYERNPPDQLAWRPRVTADVSSYGGWGIVFPECPDPAVVEALAPLAQHRREQSRGSLDIRYLDRSIGRPPRGPSRSSVTNTDSNFLLLVGSPSEIPFSVQFELEKRHVVGRISFKTPEEYSIYASSVVEAETKGVGIEPRFATFATCHPDDRATEISAYDLLPSVLEDLTWFLRKNGFTWQTSSHIGAGATKDRLLSILNRPRSPTLLLTSTHGVLTTGTETFGSGAEAALLCQGWPGPLEATEAIPRTCRFGVSDLGSSEGFKGSIVFNLSSFSIGSIGREAFTLPWANPRESELDPKLSSLAKGLSCHPKGGALAVIGQLDRLLASSFEGLIAKPQAAIYAEALKGLVVGVPVGQVLSRFKTSYLTLESNARNNQIELGSSPAAREWNRLALQMAARNAQTFAIFGDPAVRTTISSE